MKWLVQRRDEAPATEVAFATAGHRMDGRDPCCARTGAARRRLWAARRAALVVALLVLAAPVLAQRHAQPRSGSSGSSSGSRASAPSSRHSPSGPSRSSSPSVSSSRSSGSRVGSGVAHRDGGSLSGPHRPTGDRRHGGSGRGYYPFYYYPRYSFGFGYYYPYYYSPYYSPYYYGYYGYYGYPYHYPYAYRRWGYHAPYDYPAEGAGGYYDRQDLGAVALKVRPKTAEVYVDGRYVGTAGSFDGFPGYLWLEPGVYDIVLVHDGHANLEREVEVAPGQVLEFKLRLEPGTPERPEIDRDDRYDRDPRYDRDGWRERRYDDGDDWRDGDRGRRGDDYDRRGGGPPPARDLPVPRDQARDQARLVFDVRPGDASIYVDGRFVGTASEVSSSRSAFPVEPGEHTIEVVHPGFETQEREITVRAGDERLVEIGLRRDGG